MEALPTKLPGVLLLRPQAHRDKRGMFVETWRKDYYRKFGIPDMVQTNVSVSTRDVVRGLHYQWPYPQAKLVSVLRGHAIDVVVDVRVGSPTFGQGVGLELIEDDPTQVYVPEGFAHGIRALSVGTVVSYACSQYYMPDYARSIKWNDPAIKIDWVCSLSGAWVSENMVSVSVVDAEAPKLADVPKDLLPYFPS